MDDDMAVKILDALNKAKVGYGLDTDGTMFFMSKDDEKRANEIITTIENSYREEFCKVMVDIIFDKNCKLKEAALKAILKCNLTWEEFISLFPYNKLIKEKEFKEYENQEGK